MRHWRKSFSLQSWLGVVAVLALILGVSICLPRKTALSLNEKIYTGYFRGLGITDSDSFLGRRFYKIVASDAPYGYWEVDFKHAGYNEYRGYYSNGKLREKGWCYVGMHDIPRQPCPDNHDIKDGYYYRPDGTLGSTIKNGSGIQTYWYPNGDVRWRLILKDYRRLSAQNWAENGELISEEKASDNKTDSSIRFFSGPYVGAGRR
jgi:hypothetical protein